MTTKDTIEKIKKLLALGQSSNEAEAALALKMASKMMADSNLTELDLALEQDDPVGMEAFYGKFDPKWKKNLGCLIAKINHCKVVSTTNSVRIIGRDSNKTIANSMFAYIVSCINLNGKEIRKAKGEKAFHSYAIGFVYSLSSKLDQNDGWIGHGNALVVSTFESEVNSFIDETFGVCKNKPVGNTAVKDNGAFRAGVNAGQSMTLNKQVVSNAPALT